MTPPKNETPDMSNAGRVDETEGELSPLDMIHEALWQILRDANPQLVITLRVAFEMARRDHPQNYQHLKGYSLAARLFAAIEETSQFDQRMDDYVVLVEHRRLLVSELADVIQRIDKGSGNATWTEDEHEAMEQLLDKVTHE